jgi:hypothetical protein
MQDQTKQIRSDRDRLVERAIVLQALRDDHERWSRAGLEAELDHADPAAIDDALTHLRYTGVIEIADGTIRASHAAKYLDELGMIAL